MRRLRELIERWLIWLELDRRSRPRGNRAATFDRIFPPGRLPRLFAMLTELDDRLTVEAPTARHAPSPDLRKRTLEAIRQCTVTGVEETPRRWSPALATFAFCALTLLITFAAPQFTSRQADPNGDLPTASLIPNLSTSLEPQLDLIVNPLITEARSIADDLNNSARRLRSFVPLGRTDSADDPDASGGDRPAPDAHSQS